MLLQQIVNGISVGGIYALIASGYALIYSLLGFSNWAHGDVAMLGAYVGLMFVSVIKLPFALAVIVGIAGAAVISFLNERLAYRRIREHNAPTMFLMIAAMGLSVCFQNGAMLLFGAQFKMFPPVVPVAPITIGDVHIGILDLSSLIITAVALIIVEILISKTKFGLGVRATASSSKTAALLGVNINKMYALVFLIAGALAGAAGIMLGLKYNVYPSMGNIGLKAFIASVFGGLGSVRGAILGAVIIGLIEVFVSGYIASGLRDLITFALLIAVLLIKPTGLMGVDIEEKA